MGSLLKWNHESPFLEGAAGTFDLFGFTGLSWGTIKQLSEKRRKRNTIEHDLSIMTDEMISAIEEYEKEIGHLR
ncbi:MAG: hypothetical protein KAW12_24950 [Candidatus Aminicenantes bacterium]|nr:hypothetical protein [Candidatus Aminicenantes bacterium]